MPTGERGQAHRRHGHNITSWHMHKWWQRQAQPCPTPPHPQIMSQGEESPGTSNATPPCRGSSSVASAGTGRETYCGKGRTAGQLHLSWSASHYSMSSLLYTPSPCRASLLPSDNTTTSNPTPTGQHPAHSTLTLNTSSNQLHGQQRMTAKCPLHDSPPPQPHQNSPTISPMGRALLSCGRQLLQY